MIKYSILDNNYYETREYEKAACFSSIVGRSFYNKEKFIRYYIESTLKKEIVIKYLKYIKSIDLFKPFINIKEIINEGYITLDIDKMNGVQAFTILTLIRHLQEDYRLVNYIASVNTRKLSSKVTKLDLLLLASMQFNMHLHHGLALRTNKYKERNWDYWNSKTLTRETGLVGKIHSTFTPNGKFISINILDTLNKYKHDSIPNKP